MAEIIGALREDKATHGEKRVLKSLQQNLPKEFTVYVEHPIQGEREIRYPDFIVLTNYGIVVLEVKDWVVIERADKHGAIIRTRNNATRRVKNPVTQAKELAIELQEELRQKANGRNIDIPWGYAAILPNLGLSAITKLRSVWGEDFVWGAFDLRPEDRLTHRLKRTLPTRRMTSLTRRDLDFIRATVNPIVEFQREHQTIYLDEAQERIVAEPVREQTLKTAPTRPEQEQQKLFTFSDTPADAAEVSSAGEEISRNIAVRLVRGVAGSGKSIVLVQRARYLAGLYPDWDILVLTYNNSLEESLAAQLKGTGIKVQNFHSICRKILGTDWKSPTDPDGWLANHRDEYEIIQHLGVEYLSKEIAWIKEMGLKSVEAYLDIPRKGRVRKLSQSQRRAVYLVLNDYQKYLDEQGIPDWADVPFLVLERLNESKPPKQYDAILIDEAQDFAPAWIQVVNRFLKPNGVLFLADDPTQSVYRYYSWREKGIDVVGRTRWLRIPYRNTYEVYHAAYQVVAADPVLLEMLHSEGMLLATKIDPDQMRHGPRPILHKFDRQDEEIEYIRNQVQALLQAGVDARQIAVLHRRTKGVQRLSAALKGTEVTVSTFHSAKGLEFEAIFLADLSEMFVDPEKPEEVHQQERRLLFMAMTRTRNQLFMTYHGSLPPMLEPLKSMVDHIL